MNGSGVTVDPPAHSGDGVSGNAFNPHPEEGHRADFPLALDEPGLSGELLDRLGREEAGERLLDLAGLEANGSHGAGRIGIPERWEPEHEQGRFHEKWSGRRRGSGP